MAVAELGLIRSGVSYVGKGVWSYTGGGAWTMGSYMGSGVMSGCARAGGGACSATGAIAGVGSGGVVCEGGARGTEVVAPAWALKRAII